MMLEYFIMIMIAEIMIENVEKRVEENCEFKENMNDIWEMLEKSLINMIILFWEEIIINKYLQYLI